MYIKHTCLEASVKIRLLVVVLMTLLLHSCTDERPYAKFEDGLAESICECVNLGRRQSKASSFIVEYQECVNKTSAILRKGLEDYEEDPRLTKGEYLRRLDKKIQEITTSCR